MTTKESNMKLVKDIARLRIATDPECRKNTINGIMKEIMQQMDEAKEPELIKELESYKTVNRKEQVLPFATMLYIDNMIAKLNIRQATRDKNPDSFKKFSASEYNQAQEYGYMERRAAAELIARAFMNDRPDVLISATAAELYMYNYEAMIRDLCAQAIKILTDICPRERRQQVIEKITGAGIRPTLITFNENEKGAIENMEKIYYYKKWIYEKFQPIGVVYLKFEFEKESGKEPKKEGDIS